MTREPERRLPRRFYKDAGSEPGESGHRILLDGKPVRTPRKHELALPSEALAQAIVAEWQEQGERIDPETMPLTRTANSAIDLVRGREQAIVDEIAAFAASDLLCYRAEAPDGLIARQREQWDPVLAWAADALGVRFNLAEGVVHITQPEDSLAKMRAALAAYDAFGLAALHNITTLTGSALIALAHAEGRLTAEQAWAAAHVDEDWQISQWGEDAEAARRRERRRQEFLAASRLLHLLRHRA